MNELLSAAAGAMTGGALTGLGAYVGLRSQLSAVQATLVGIKENNQDFLRRIERLERLHLGAEHRSEHRERG